MRNQTLLLIVACSAAAGAAGGYFATVAASRENDARIQQILAELERQKSAAEPEKISRTSFKLGLADRGPSQKGGDANAAGSSAADFLDNAKTYQGKDLAFYMVADSAYMRDFTLRDILKASPHYPMIYHLDGYKVTGRITIEFPIGLEVPATAMDERILIHFRCVQGRIDAGNIVTSVERPEK